MKFPWKICIEKYKIKKINSCGTREILFTKYLKKLKCPKKLFKSNKPQTYNVIVGMLKVIYIFFIKVEFSQVFNVVLQKLQRKLMILSYKKKNNKRNIFCN